MNTIPKIYTKQIHNCFKPLYANWQPDTPIKLGDFGVLRDNLFIRMGNINNYGIIFSTRINSGDSTKSYFSKNGVAFKLNGKAEVQDVKASIEVSFDSDEGVFFNISGCSYSSIENKVEVGDEILMLNRQKKWMFDYVVVTDIVTAKNGLIMVSGGKKSTIKLEADADIPEIDLASASLSLNISAQKHIGFLHKNPQEITPLLGFSRIFSRFFGTDVFEPENLLPEEENSTDELYFDELRS